MSEVIVQGAFTLDANDRDLFVEASVESMRASRQEAGCIEYVMAADPLDPERVILSERWESIEHLKEHLAQPRTGARSTEGRPAPRDMQIEFYEVTATRPLG